MFSFDKFRVILSLIDPTSTGQTGRAEGWTITPEPPGLRLPEPLCLVHSTVSLGSPSGSRTQNGSLGEAAPASHSGPCSPLKPPLKPPHPASSAGCNQENSGQSRSPLVGLRGGGNPGRGKEGKAFLLRSVCFFILSP